MRLPEQQLWDRMRSNVLHRDSVWIERIESMVSTGLPDVHAIRKGSVSWTELKCAARWTKRANTPLLGVAKGLSIDQRNWHLNWTNHGGGSFIVIGIKDMDDHWCIPGALADHVNMASVEDLNGMACAKGVGPKFWIDYISFL